MQQTGTGTMPRDHESGLVWGGGCELWVQLQLVPTPNPPFPLPFHILGPILSHPSPLHLLSLTARSGVCFPPFSHVCTGRRREHPCELCLSIPPYPSSFLQACHAENTNKMSSIKLKTPAGSRGVTWPAHLPPKPRSPSSETHSKQGL